MCRGSSRAMQGQRRFVGVKQSFAGDGGVGGAVEEASPLAGACSGVLGARVNVGMSLLCLGGNRGRERSEPGRPVTGGTGGAEGVVAAFLGVQDACASEEVPRGRTGGTSGVSRVHLAADAPWTRSTGSVWACGGRVERGDGVRD